MADLTTGPGGEAFHWYQAAKDGTPALAAYEIRGSNGQMRPTTLRDARKLNLYPSVTTILSIAARPGLETWKRRNAIKTALERTWEFTPETLDATIKAIELKAAEEAKQKADEGTAIHAAIEESFAGGVVTPYRAHVENVRRALADVFGDHHLSDWRTEEAFTHSLGYGGRIDLWSPVLNCVADIKTKDFNDPSEAKVWPENARQLAAYRNGVSPEFFPHPMTCLNILVSRQTGEVVVHKWLPEQIDKAWAEFRCLLELWQIEKGYRPA